MSNRSAASAAIAGYHAAIHSRIHLYAWTYRLIETAALQLLDKELLGDTLLREGIIIDLEAPRRHFSRVS
jgi:hypothetical protein